MTNKQTLAMPIIKDEELVQLICPILRDYVSLNAAMAEMKPSEIPKPLIGRLLLESSKCEEMLDAYGALRNKFWSSVRRSIAITKSFSRVIYNVFHIYHTSPSYNLLEIEGNFIEDTEKALNKLLQSMISGAIGFMKVAQKKRLNESLQTIESYCFRDMPIKGRLEANQKQKTIKDPRDTVVYLASSMLNLVEESSWLAEHSKIEVRDYHTLIPSVISEERLRGSANSFHSLQSLYDTYLAGTVSAEKDKRLPVMRGNLTVVFHLLDTAVTLIHFYERHAQRKWTKELRAPLSNSELLNIIIDYFIAYADKYIIATQNLCQDILKSYAVQGRIEVPVPCYRGFHVRPSTLISKIVIHYGSEVKMKLGMAVYDASRPLELFRANEELNKRKRDTIVCYIMENKLIRNDKAGSMSESEMKTLLRMVFFDLIKKHKIMVYHNDYSINDLTPYKDEALEEFVKRGISRYLAEGKIDIISGDTVVFQGDNRVLEDIKILAENGYGEDKFGNNIVLSQQLSYLKR